MTLDYNGLIIFSSKRIFFSICLESTEVKFLTAVSIEHQAFDLRKKERVLKRFSPMPDAYSEPCQTSKTERFAKIVNGLKSLTILAICSILDVRQGSEYASECYL